jgi:hypothetical protein
LEEAVDTIEHGAIGSNDPFDLVEGVDDGGVIPAPKDFTDLGQRQIGQLPTEVHADLTTHHQWLAAAWSLHF